MVTNEQVTTALDKLAVRQIYRAFREAGGRFGFDPSRDERTNTKTKLIAYVAANCTWSALIPAIELVANSKDETKPEGIKSATVERVPPTVAPIVTVTLPSPEIVEAAKRVDAAHKAETLLKPNDGVAGQLAALLASLASTSVDEAKVRAIVDSAVKEAVSANSVIISVKTPERPEPIKVGVQHERFGDLLTMCNARTFDGQRLNVWLAGPAGTGKTTAARNVAKALGLDFFTNGALDQAYKVSGFVDAQGRYRNTAFREAWQHGGVYLFDEFDASMPGAALELNTALAGGLFTFPDETKPIVRHENCIVLAGANTHGMGGTGDYNGRMKQDVSLIDRFVTLDWPIDETLERALCSDVKWVSRVQSVRAKVKTAQIRGVVITPRATIFGAALLAAGMKQEAVEAATLRKGMSDTDWQKVLRS